MSEKLKPIGQEANFISDDGEIYLRFPFVTVHAAFGHGSYACLPCLREPSSQQAFGAEWDSFSAGNSGVLAEISVWLNEPDGKGNDLRVAGFPFSSTGYPLGFATTEQFASIVHWASLLQEAPPAQQYKPSARKTK